jgi:hypothetical protein
MPGDPRPLFIRNPRYPRWFDIIGGMLIALIAFGTIGAFFIPRPYDRLTAAAILGGLVGLGLLVLFGLFQLWDLRRPGSGRPVTARALFQWLVLGIRRKELGPADGWTVLAAFRPAPGSRRLVHHLKVGEGIEVDNSFVVARFPARAVTRVTFAPDPNEDYAGAERPVHCCETTIETEAGRTFCLIVEEPDARRLRQWAVEKGIAVCDQHGYVPRPVEPAPES